MVKTIDALVKMGRVCFPFVRELLFGDDNSEEVVRRNKMVVFLMGCLMSLFVFYYHNSYEFNLVVVANNSLEEKAAVLQSRVDAAGQTIKTLNYDLSLARTQVACPPSATDSQAQKNNVLNSALLAALKSNNDMLKIQLSKCNLLPHATTTK
jgi:hypothetical protein